MAFQLGEVVKARQGGSKLLAQPLGAGVTTLGIPIGLGVIAFTVIITGLYVRRANDEYDRLTAEILEDATP